MRIRAASTEQQHFCMCLQLDYWKLKTAFHRYETACQNIGFLLCLENFPRLPTGAQIAFRVTNTVKQRAV